VVRNAVTAMGEIERSASEINQIIGVIDGIAFQTNLLALNAGVEAARAGDAGKGFAVVASEVRSLAMRSAEAAQDIKNLINASSQQVTQGVTLVAETGSALEHIIEQIGGLRKTIDEIANSAEVQARDLAEINTVVSEMERMTQQNAAMVEESTAAARSLNDQARTLDRRLAGSTWAGAPAVRLRPPRRLRARAGAARLARTGAKTQGSGQAGALFLCPGELAA
jgi:methyl-accepting chemotaxis protein